jgi:multidrug efflux pump subunit AcrA (membrane-fusion protein)
MKKQILVAVITLALIGLWAAKQYLSHNSASEKTKITKVDGTNYWTCVMHPQIHLSHSGECPICHMKLIQVKAQEVPQSESQRSDVQASSGELDLIGIQKEEVERMDLNVVIPISGRLISPSTVAFQVYESDAHLIKSGLSFTGQNSFTSDGEISGVITSIDSIIDPTSRTVRVVGRIEKGSKGLIPETTFSGKVIVSLKDRIAIPESSVLHTGTTDLVYVFTDGAKLSARSVQLGPKSEGFYEVISGLKLGEKISSGPNFLIDSEAKLRGISEQGSVDGKPSAPTCPNDQHWDTPMAMCMPGKPSGRDSK